MKRLTHIMSRDSLGRPDSPHSTRVHVDAQMINWMAEPSSLHATWTIDLGGHRFFVDDEDAKRLMRDYGDPDPALYDDQELQDEYELAEARMLRLAKEIERRRS